MEMPADGWDTMLFMVWGGVAVEMVGLAGLVWWWCCRGGGVVGTNEKGVSHDGSLEVSLLSRVIVAGGNSSS